MERWTDERLDDRFAAIDRTLQRLEEVTRSMTDVPRQLREVVADAHECRQGVEALRSALRERAHERAEERISALQRREQEQEATKAEKKKDRRWIIGTLIGASAVIVAAVGIIVTSVT